MIYIPFIFFSLLTAYWWIKHQGIDVCVYMSALYTLTSFIAIILVEFDMLEDGGICFDAYDAEFNIIPTLTYCAFLGVGMLPFSIIYKNDLKQISSANPFLIYLFSWFLIGIALLNLYLIADSTAEILSGDLSTIRSDHYKGIESPAQVKAESMPFILRFLYYFNNSTLLALPLAFYYMCFEKRSVWFVLAMFFTSFSMPLAGIQSADRTEIVFYAMMFISCLIFFYPHLSKKLKRGLKIVTIPIAILSITYVVLVSDARFSKREGGAVTYALQYAGQGYLNYCFFWEKANKDYITGEREFPLIYHYVFHIDNDDYRREVRSGQQGFFMSVFATYIGDVLLDLTPIGLIIWLMAFFTISVVIFKRPHREELGIGEVIMFFVLSVVPIFGIFYYRYMSFQYTFTLILASMVFLLDKFKLKI